jgi:hypothetical protein
MPFDEISNLVEPIERPPKVGRNAQMMLQHLELQ